MNRLPTDRPATVDGVLLLDKPAGMTSNRALQTVKRLLGARKAGHTGALDPLATGMLPLCFGEATKASAFLLAADKTYRVVARLGRATDTGDAEGGTTRTAAVPEMAASAWAELLASFLGESLQVPPMYSALKKNGKRLYELARRGEEVEREPRRIRLSAIGLLESAGPRLVFRVRCSKGTYVRTLVEDIAARAGTVAYTQHLHRESVAGFEGEAMLGLETAERLAAEGPAVLAGRLMPPDRALAALPAVTLGPADAARFRQGMPVAVNAVAANAVAANAVAANAGEANAGAAPGLVRVYGPPGGDAFLGIGERGAAGQVAPKRVFGVA